MAKALTAKALESCRPGKSRRELPDGLVRGLFFILQPSGKASWAVRYRVARKTRKLTIGSYPGIDLKSARELASRALVQIARGEDPAAQKKAAKEMSRIPKNEHLVENVLESFINRYAKSNSPRTWNGLKRSLEKDVVARWRGRPLASITRSEVHEVLDAIIDRGSPIQANRVLAAFRRMCDWAVERDIIPLSPCVGIKAPSNETSRDRVLSDDELRQIWEASAIIGWPFGPLVRLLMLTGQRLREVAEMRWSELDFHRKLWTLPKSRVKNGIEHTVPLSAQALAVMGSLPHIAGKIDFVFTTKANTPVSGFTGAKARLDAALSISLPKMAGWTLHDLRRTFASGCARLGTNLPVIEKLLNHVSGSFGGIVGVYQRHSFSDEKRFGMELWGSHLLGLVNEPVASNVVEGLHAA
jgi:integrase